MYKSYIFSALHAHAAQDNLSAHMPGHKNGTLLPETLKNAWGENVFRYDLTELPGLDNLHDPQGIIQKSQEQSAAIFGAQAAHYLINGSSGGLHAALMALAAGEEIFVPRHCHRSIYHGLMLAEAKAIYLPVTLDEKWGLPLGVALTDLKKAISAHPSCRNLLIVNPTYQGLSWQNAQLITYAKEIGLNVIVDEAHGAHFHFNPALPPSAIDLGADLVVQSWHKTLPALTGSSCLLVGSDYQGRNLTKVISILQSTSPSYLLLSSLEAAAIYLAVDGKEDIAHSLKEIAQFKQDLALLTTISYLHNDAWQADPFKLNLYSTVLNGEQLAAKLQNEHIYVEMSEANSCLLLLPLKFTAAYRQRLFQALAQIEQATKALPPRALTKPFYLPTIPQTKYPLKQALWQAKEAVNIEEALGRAAAEFMLQYPPGIPLLLPGEIISAEAIDLLRTYPQYQRLAVLQE